MTAQGASGGGCTLMTNVSEQRLKCFLVSNQVTFSEENIRSRCGISGYPNLVQVRSILPLVTLFLQPIDWHAWEGEVEVEDVTGCIEHLVNFVCRSKINQ